jgi:hypothetical protein
MRHLVLLLAAAAALLAWGAPAASAAPGWLPAQIVSGSSTVVSRPKVAMDARGDAVAIWNQAEPGAERVEAATRPPGGAWSAPVKISPAGLETVEPRVAMAASGEAIVSWGTESGKQEAQVTTLAPGAGSWSTPLTISDPTIIAEAPVLAVDSAGDVTAAWEQYDGVTFRVAVASRPAGGAWSAPLPISPAKTSGYAPALAVDDLGDTVVVWEQQALQVEAAARLKGGAWSAPAEVSAGGEEVREPEVGIDAAGEAVATWDRYDGTTEFAQAATMSPAGAWSKPEDISDGAYNAYDPSVAVAADGEAIAIWERSSVTEGLVVGATRAPGSGWSKPVTLTPTDQSSGDASIALSPAGLAVLTWQDQPAPLVKATPYAATRPRGGAWSAPVGLAPAARPGNYPVAATDSAGDAVAVWEAFGTGVDEIEAAAFDGAPPQLGAVSIPANGQVGEPLTFSVAASDAFSPLAEPVWQFGDGSIYKGFAVSHAFLKPGEYAVSVRVSDGLGNTSTAEGKVTVSAVTTGPSGAPRGLARVARGAVVKKGMAALEVDCAGGDCAGAVELLAPPPRGGKRRRRRPVLAGEASFRLAAGESAAVKMRVRPSVLTRLRRSPTLRLGTTLQGTDVQPGKVILREAKRKHRGRHRHR